MIGRLVDRIGYRPANDLDERFHDSAADPVPVRTGLSLMSFVKHLWHDWDVLHARQREVDLGADRAEERTGPEDVGDQTLMRGLDTALPFVRPGLSLSAVGRQSYDRPRRDPGSSPCRGPVLTSARLIFDGGPLLIACCYV